MDIDSAIVTPTADAILDSPFCADGKLLEPFAAFRRSFQLSNLLRQHIRRDDFGAECAQRWSIIAAIQRDKRIQPDFVAAGDYAVLDTSEAGVPYHVRDKGVRSSEKERAKFVARLLGLDGEAARLRPPAAAGLRRVSRLAFGERRQRESGEEVGEVSFVHFEQERGVSFHRVPPR